MLNKDLYEKVIVVSVKIYIEGVTEMSELSKQMSLGELFDSVLEWINEQIDADSYKHIPAQVGASFFHKMFPETDWKKWSVWMAEFGPDSKPYLQLKTDGRDWVRVQADQFPHQFAFNAGRPKSRELIFEPIPDCYRSVDGAILGDKMIFREDSGCYPMMVLYPGEYDVIGRLDYLLTPEDFNPATILKRSPQPYKGLGSQVVDMLEDLRKVAVESLEATFQR